MEISTRLTAKILSPICNRPHRSAGLPVIIRPIVEPALEADEVSAQAQEEVPVVGLEGPAADQDLELMKIFNLDHKTMCRWLLTVKKNYRPEVVYHNWRHAFNVCQVSSSGTSSSSSIPSFTLIRLCTAVWSTLAGGNHLAQSRVLVYSWRVFVMILITEVDRESH